MSREIKGVRTEREGPNNGRLRSEKKVHWCEMAVMQKQLNEESRVELKDTSNAPNIIDWNHGTGNAVKRINPLNRRVPTGTHGGVRGRPSK